MSAAPIFPSPFWRRSELLWIAMLLIVVPSLFYYPALDYLNLPREMLWVGSAFLLFCLQSWFRDRKGWVVDQLDAAMLIFIFWAGASVLWAWHGELGWTRWSLLATGYFSFSLARRTSDRGARFLLWLLVIQSAALCLLGFVQFLCARLAEMGAMPQHLASLSGWLESTTPQTERPGLTMGHRNVAAEYLLLTFAVVLSLLRPWSKAPAKSILLCAIALAHLALLTIIACRGVLIGLLVATDVVLIKVFLRPRMNFSPGARRIAIFGFIFAHAFLAANIWLAVAGRHPYVDSAWLGAKTESVNMRKAHYSNSLVMAREALPQGIGLGNFALAYTSYIHALVPDIHYSDRLILKNAHSDPLEILAELGPIGLLLALYVVWLVFFRVPIFNPGDDLLKAGLLAQFVNSFFNFPFQIIQTQLVCAVLLGLLARGKTVGTQHVLSFPRSRVLLALFFALFLFYTRYQLLRLEASAVARRGLEHLVASQPAKALPHLRRAVALAPRNADILMLLAYALSETNTISESSSVAESVLGVFPGFLPALNLIGLNALRINDLNRAMRVFERSFELQPYQEPTRKKLSDTYQRLTAEFRAKGFIAQARELEQKRAVLYPELVEPVYFQVIDLMALGQLEEAQAVLDKLPPPPGDTRYCYVAAKLAFARNDSSRAMDWLGKGLAINPDDEGLKAMRSALSGAASDGPTP